MSSVLWLIAMMGPKQGEGSPGDSFKMFIPMLIVFAIFYFMLLRPQQRKEKQRRKMIEEIKSGARVLFSGGIIGTVVNVKESTFVIKIADKVKIEVARGAVIRVLEKGEKAEVDESTQSR